MRNSVCVVFEGFSVRFAAAVVGVFLALGGLSGCATTKKAQLITPAVQGPAAGQPPAPLDGKKLAQERCTTCHGFYRVTIGKILPVPAHTVVDHMIRKGAKLNAEEREAVINYMRY